MYYPDKITIIAAAGAERRKVMSANNIFCRFFHGSKIEFGFNLPGDRSKMGRHNLTVKDQILVLFAFGGKASVKSRRFGLSLDNPNILRQNRVQGNGNFTGRHGGFDFEADNIAERMDTRIGAGGGVKFNWLFIDLL